MLFSVGGLRFIKTTLLSFSCIISLQKILFRKERVFSYGSLRVKMNRGVRSLAKITLLIALLKSFMNSNLLG